MDGQKVAQLSASTNGTPGGTSQTEFLQTGMRFLEGTYASRIKFHDAPAAGPDGDHVNQTFFAIGPAQRFDYDPLYSELDFSEYLPNGGWGTSKPTNYQTSYNGYRADPWDPRNAQSEQSRSLEGWHDVVAQVAGGHVKYFIDGTLVGDHTVDDKTGTYSVYPRAAMTIDFNLWFVDLAGHSGAASTWQQHVDWVYHAKNTVLSPAAVASRVSSLRAAGSTHRDDIAAGACIPGDTGTGSGPTGAVASGIAGKCLDVKGAGTANGTPVQLWSCNGTGAQRWARTADNTLTALGKCLDAAGGGTANRTKLQLWDCNGTAAQQWQPHDGGYRNPVSGRCLDDPGASTTDGTQLQLWDCNSTNAQKWSLPAA
ncbi:glycoside hydrolase family 16 protein [Cellulomonas chitinilytica]|uniref:glycoside hydrolase family 16 protein n=1 Tax=Cellulomonas chitinilytica TaxID=398759 RepID=UPI001EF19F09|nr:glycoside hydrolase family 16 protein [Cellulomonas chitinilytica]